MKIWKKASIIILVALAATLGITYAASRVYWTKTLTGAKIISIVGIEASLLGPNFDSYVAHVEALTLDDNNQIALCIDAENFQELWLQVDVSGNYTEPFNATCVGQYYKVQYVTDPNQWFSWFHVFDPVSEPFNIPLGNQTIIDKTLTIYRPITQPGAYPMDSAVGHCLVLSFGFSELTHVGIWRIDLTFSLGTP